jgi:hypothetical protein
MWYLQGFDISFWVWVVIIIFIVLELIFRHSVAFVNGSDNEFEKLITYKIYNIICIEYANNEYCKEDWPVVYVWIALLCVFSTFLWFITYPILIWLGVMIFLRERKRLKLSKDKKYSIDCHKGIVIRWPGTFPLYMLVCVPNYCPAS